MHLNSNTLRTTLHFSVPQHYQENMRATPDMCLAPGMCAMPQSGRVCSICTVTLTGQKERKKHMKLHPKCSVCSQHFPATEQLQGHLREIHHLYCNQCDVHFLNYALHVNHVRTVPHATTYECCDCGREYPTQKALNKHCCHCDKVFSSKKKLRKHSKTYGSDTLGVRVTRASIPKSKDTVFQVFGDIKFPIAGEKAGGRSCKCNKCDETFKSRAALKKHKRSKHAPLRNIPCPTSEKCMRRFATPSAVLSHLESGRCCSGMSREKLNGLVLTHDRNHYITGFDMASEAINLSEKLSTATPSAFQAAQAATGSGPSNFPLAPSSPVLSTTSATGSEHSITSGFFSQISVNTDGFNSPPEGVILPSPSIDSVTSSEWSLINSVPLTPTTSEWSFLSNLSNVLTPNTTSISVVDIDLNIPASSLRCALCPPTRPAFSTVTALQQHSTSAAHSPKIFHCPLAFMPENESREAEKKKRFFSTLSGLTQHLESGACPGKTETFRRAIGYVEDQLKVLGLGNIRLLME